VSHFVLEGDGIRTAVCIRSWISGVCACHSGAKSSLVLRVRIQMYRPKTSEMVDVTVTKPALILSQPRD